MARYSYNAASRRYGRSDDRQMPLQKRDKIGIGTLSQYIPDVMGIVKPIAIAAVMLPVVHQINEEYYSDPE